MEQPSKFKFKLQLPYVDRTYKQFTAPQPPLILECTVKLEIEILGANNHFFVYPHKTAFDVALTNPKFFIAHRKG